MAVVTSSTKSTRRRRGEIQQGILNVLSAHPEGLPAHLAIKRVAEVVPPTPFEAADYPNRPGVRRFDKIVRFWTIGPVKAGWIIKEQGQWRITDEGRRVLTLFKDPLALADEDSRLYRQWKKSQPEPPDEDSEAASVETPPEHLAYEEAEEAAWAEISDYLDAMNPYDFQRLVATLLEAMGYHIAWVAEPGPDRGLDILAYTDALGATGPRMKVQVKRRTEKTTAEGLRSFLALLSDQDIGIYVATGGFTRDAETEWRNQMNRKLTLIDKRKLLDLWVKHYSSLSEEAKTNLSLKPVYYLAPRE